eukprot:TRINITY_DN14714_c0_g1_i1.p1 TRINITY_DN14714_c0_g1~~TRINITY_DN14714_c0_g1_i1.p1  ORF type:complete len:266 (+),score=22.39 TRINITY_DN14714_c0_g1_i1:78-875(+)
MSALQLFLAIACVFSGLPEARRAHDFSTDSDIESDHHLGVSWSPQQDVRDGSFTERVATGAVPVDKANKDDSASRDLLGSRPQYIHNGSFIERVATGAVPVDKANKDDVASRDLSGSRQQDVHNGSFIERVATGAVPVDKANRDDVASRDLLGSRQQDLHNASFIERVGSIIERVATGAMPVDRANYHDDGGKLTRHEWVRCGIGVVVMFLMGILLAYYRSCRKDDKGERVDQASTSSDCPPAAEFAKARSPKGLPRKVSFVDSS